MFTAQYWIEKLKLANHLEGGAFREIYRAALMLPQTALAEAHKADRNAMTSIYYLLQQGDFSALHRIASDEVWHFYDGAPLSIFEIEPTGVLTEHLLGKDLDKGQSPVVIISAGSWFGSRVKEGGGFTLCGCSVAPGFDFQDFELADRGALIAQYPQHAGIISELTR